MTKNLACFPLENGEFVPATKLFFYPVASELFPFAFQVPNSLTVKYPNLLRGFNVADQILDSQLNSILHELKGFRKALNINQLKCVVYILGKLCQNNDFAHDGNILVPNTDRHLVPASEVMSSDPTWDDRINAKLIHLVHPLVPQEVLQKLNIKTIGSTVIERLRETVQPVVVKDQADTAERLTSIIQSKEFQDGVTRIIKHEDPTASCEETKLELFSVKTVESLCTQVIDTRTNKDLTKKENAASLCVISLTEKTIYLKAELPPFFSHEELVARQLNLIWHNKIRDTQALQSILTCNVSHIKTKLDYLGFVPNTKHTLQLDTQDEKSLDPIIYLYPNEEVIYCRSSDGASPNTAGIVDRCMSINGRNQYYCKYRLKNGEELPMTRLFKLGETSKGENVSQLAKKVERFLAEIDDPAEYKIAIYRLKEYWKDDATMLDIITKLSN